MDDGRRAVGANSAPPTPPQGRWAKALDGGRTWGAIDIWPNRHGFRKYRLVVFPPGTSPTERRYVRLARSWPTWGAALWLLLAVGVGARGDGWTTLVYPTAAFMLTGAITSALARGVHSNIRSLSAILISGYDDPDASAQYARLEALACTLIAADAMRDRGELTVVEHEAVWWTVYDALGQKDLHDV